jgi:hypothetical protein
MARWASRRHRSPPGVRALNRVTLSCGRNRAWAEFSAIEMESPAASGALPRLQDRHAIPGSHTKNCSASPFSSGASQLSLGDGVGGVSPTSAGAKRRAMGSGVWSGASIVDYSSPRVQHELGNGWAHMPPQGPFQSRATPSHLGRLVVKKTLPGDPSALLTIPRSSKPWSYVDTKSFSAFDRCGCWSFLTTLASIWRIRSRVSRKSRPTSSSV